MSCSPPGSDLLYSFILYTVALIWLIPVQIACCNLADTYTAFQSLGHRSLFSFTILGVLITHLITSLGNSKHGVRNCTANYPVEHAYHIKGTLLLIEWLDRFLLRLLYFGVAKEKNRQLHNFSQVYRYHPI